MRLRTTAVAALIVLVGACDNKPRQVTWSKPATETLSCENYAAKVLDSGVLYNNVWNKSAAKNFPWRQCLERNPANGDYGWSWSWPETTGTTFAFPHIRAGTSPWGPEPKTHPAFPLRIADARSLLVTHELAVDAPGEHNVVTLMWLTNTRDIGPVENPSVITAEVKIWSYATANHMDPAG